MSTLYSDCRLLTRSAPWRLIHSLPPWRPCAVRALVWYMRVVSGYRQGAVELLYEGSVPPQRHIARIFGDQLGVEVADVHPFCVFDAELIRQYQDGWAHLPRPWIVVNRKSNNSPNKDWMDQHWDLLIASLLNHSTVIEIGTGGQGGQPVQHPHYVELTGRLPLKNFLAAVAAGDIHVGPMSGPVHIAAAAGKPSVVIYGGYEVPECSSYPENINIYTKLPCSPCWLLQEPCPYDRICLSRISPEHSRAGDCVLGPAWIVNDSGPGLASALRTPRGSALAVHRVTTLCEHHVLRSIQR